MSEKKSSSSSILLGFVVALSFGAFKLLIDWVPTILLSPPMRGFDSPAQPAKPIAKPTSTRMIIFDFMIVTFQLIVHIFVNYLYAISILARGVPNTANKITLRRKSCNQDILYVDAQGDREMF